MIESTHLHIFGPEKPFSHLELNFIKKSLKASFFLLFSNFSLKFAPLPPLGRKVGIGKILLVLQKSYLAKNTKGGGVAPTPLRPARVTKICKVKS